MAAVAQRLGMAGRLSALLGTVGQIPGIIATLAGGWLTSHLGRQQVFFVVAGLTALLPIPSVRRPASVFGDATPVPQPGSLDPAAEAA
jgi:MFS family permease